LQQLPTKDWHVIFLLKHLWTSDNISAVCYAFDPPKIKIILRSLDTI
jgi:hypothetical protein